MSQRYDPIGGRTAESSNPFEDSEAIEPDQGGVSGGGDADEDVFDIEPDIPMAVPETNGNGNGKSSERESIVPDVAVGGGGGAYKNKSYEGGLFSTNYYRQFFDLNTAEFFTNCYKSINPFNQLQDSELNEVGDLYGAIWITGTLIVLLFFSNSLSNLIMEWLNHKDTNNKNYFNLLVFSINLLYGYLFIIPLLLYVLLRFYFKLSFILPLSKIISIYGYSNIWWIPAAFLSIVRGILSNHQILKRILEWCLIGFGGILSGLSIFTKLFSILQQSFSTGSSIGPESLKYTYLISGFLGLCHIGFTIAVKVSFFGKIQ
ncbi:hypothetical protein PACTADRAFT_49953 [Pachysolen tannophilus NRRL Y-2460]|uniref:Protein YIP n=1 Tax=Pachysolen tannophilus NRRL Y-2460 TaxID=669874 RepID=A0A1E4TTT0_PACTA|nr:hypothetical protein PACTADRAFT_49953 [Pachysolen tannophilus NRRL Y-2460]